MQRSPTGSISGQVVRADREQAIAGATVGISQAAGPVPDIALVTDASGWFTIDELSAGAYTLRACGPTGETGDVSAHVLAGGVSTVRIRVC